MTEQGLAFIQKVPQKRCLGFMDSWGKYLAPVAECSTALSSKLQHYLARVGAAQVA